jgi:lipopolysaccharide/colanic/teichoic acid biosynthesis glycosyltransferase
MAVAAILVRFASGKPILFRHRRVGKNGTQFMLLKFRTMSNSMMGANVTRAGDPRVTLIGKILRKWKIDELPQLVNVLRGEMSLVGPRPDVVEYLETLNPAQKKILKLRPGITGAATLCYRNEEQLLSTVEPKNLKSFYCTQVLPEKVRIDLSYAQRASFAGDVAILWRTLFAVAS